jgi:hypothetical protein
MKSDLSFDRDIIGEVLLNYHGKLLSRIRKHSKKTFELDFNPCNSCELGLDFILCCDNNNKRLVVLDKTFKVIKTIDRMDGQPIATLGITTNSSNRVFISDYQSCKVYATDFSFRLVKTFGNDTPVNDKNSLSHPYDLFYYNSSLYICDCRNQRILKVNDDLNFEELYNLNYQPWQIKITNNTVCVRANNSVLYFYDLPMFSLRFKYTDHDGPICVYNSFFYEFSEKHKKIFCFDWNGKLDDSVELNVGVDALHTSYRIAVINDQFIISARGKFIVI